MNQVSSNNNVPMFAVIVPLYNAAAYLDETLRAIQAQTFRDFEVVMVDDGSTDTTAELALGYVRRDERFHLIRTSNRGISPSRNTAVTHSSAPWLAVCDGDDVWLPEKLSLQAEFIRAWEVSGNRPLAAVGTAGHFINAAGERFSEIDPPQEPWPADADQIDSSPELKIINSSVVFRRDFFLKAGQYGSDYKATEDLDLWLRLLEYGSVVNLPEHLTLYRMHGLNLSHQSYIPMLLHAQRCYINAERRKSRLPLYTHEEYIHSLRRDPTSYELMVRSMRQMMFYNMGKVNLHNRRYFLAARALFMAAAAAPKDTLRLTSKSKVVRRLAGAP
ncbi:glycosyltransferase family 2 protein [Deinococcus koreensis]|nr:glycosyltransferase family A protein [Deinococcus koreensis]